MRIAYLSADYGIPVLGGKGGSVHIQSLVRAFARAGHEVTVYCARCGDGSAEGVPARLVEVARPDGGPPQVTEAGASNVSERFAKERGWMARASAMELHVLADHADRPFEMIYERYSLWSRAGVRVAAQARIPCIVEMNAPLVAEAEAYRELAAKAEAKAIEREVLQNAGGIVAVSDAVAEYAMAHGAAAGRVHVIPNGVDVASFASGQAGDATRLSAIPAGAVTIGFVGGLKPWHGLQELMRAFREVCAHHRDVHLAIVGDGPMRGWIEGFADGTGLSARTHVTGWVPHEELPALLARMDIVTAPYPKIADFYFSPLKLFEYMAGGRAIVASRIGQIDGIIRHDHNGLLVEPGDATALAAALSRLISDGSARHRLGVAAHASASTCSWDRVAERIVALAPASCVARSGGAARPMADARCIQ